DKVPDAVWSAATRFHHEVFDLLLAVIAIHILANVVYFIWKRENLVRAMITGRKPRMVFEDEQEAAVAGWWRAILCLAVSLAIVFGGIVLAGGRL
ncbi:MAG: cytochrome B, partial [Hyphomicrobiaceae bacterium]